MRYESNYEKYYGIDPYNPGNTLKQHGVKGQKWGVWNEETRARRLRDRRRGSSSDNSSSKSNSRPKSEIGGLFKIKTTKVKDTDIVKRANQAAYEEKVKKAPVKRMHVHDEWSGNDWDVDVRQAFDQDLNDANVKYVIDAFGINADDLVVEAGINNTPKLLAGIYRKDGKNFKFKYVPWNETFECADLNAFAWEGDWPIFMTNDPETGERKIDTTKVKLIHSDLSNSYYATEPYDPRTTAKQHGVKGQKWGVWNEETRARRLRDRRRKGNSQASVIGSNNNIFNKIKNSFSKNKSEEPPHLKRTHLTKELAEISDAELNAAIKRMQLEQTYLQMLKNYPDSSDKGKKYADQFTDQLFNSLSNGLGGAMGRRIAKAIDSWFDDDSAEKEKRKKYEAEAKRKSDDEIKKRNARDAIVNQYVTNRLNEDKNK